MTHPRINWQQIACFWVPGEPAPQPRPRARSVRVWSDKKRRHVWTARVYDNGDANGWKQRIGAFGQRHQPEAPIDGPVRVDIEFRLPRPQRLMRRRDGDGLLPCAARPDIDNYVKSVLDAMTGAGWWRDDGQICVGQFQKFYCEKSGPSGAWVKVSVPAAEPVLFGE